MPKYFDIHSHLNFKDYNEDLGEVVQRMRDSSTRTIVVGTDLASSKWAVDLAEKFEGVYACIGVHPVDDPKQSFDKDEFEKLAKNPKVVAVGECGLDFFRTPRSLGEVEPVEFNRQRDLFLEQINFALDHDLPLMIHSRDAYTDLLEILEPMKKAYGEKLRGDVHFFAGSLAVAKRFWAIGFATSFTGVITFARQYDEVIKNAPIEMLMSETDAPFVAPAPYRGKRNEPSYVEEVVSKITEIRGEDLETVQKALVNNAFRLFQITA